MHAALSTFLELKIALNSTNTSKSAFCRFKNFKFGAENLADNEATHYGGLTQIFV